MPAERPNNINLNTLRVAEQKPFSGVKKPENQSPQAPKSGEFQLPPRQSESVSRGQSSQPNPEELTPDGENPHRFQLRRSPVNPDKWELIQKRGPVELHLGVTPARWDNSPEEMQAAIDDLWDQANRDIERSYRHIERFRAWRQKRSSTTDEDQ